MGLRMVFQSVVFTLASEPIGYLLKSQVLVPHSIYPDSGALGCSLRIYILIGTLM